MEPDLEPKNRVAKVIAVLAAGTVLAVDAALTMAPPHIKLEGLSLTDLSSLRHAFGTLKIADLGLTDPKREALQAFNICAAAILTHSLTYGVCRAISEGVRKLNHATSVAIEAFRNDLS